MFRLTIGEIAPAVKGRIVSGDNNLTVTKVSTDSRKIDPGSLFVALKGERFDAHEFCSQAVADGAVALLVSRPVEVPAEVAVILVEDTLDALQNLARLNRSRFAGPVIAVTGSNGKTTTKDMITSVLEQKFKVLKTKGNYNNEIGLPLTLLNLDETYDTVVLEMGMRGLGEIDLLASIARPTGAVITNIGETHLERLGSVENIARAKTELLPYVAVEGYTILNGDDQWQKKYAHLTKSKVIFYGMHENNDVRAEEIDTSSGLATEFKACIGATGELFTLPVPGRHNVYNALAAIAVGWQAGLTWNQIKQGIRQVTLTGMRLQIIDYNHMKIINDTYNANPASTQAALRILADMPGAGRKIAVLGDMYELGERTVSGHRETGEVAVEAGVEILVAVGELAQNIYLGAIDKGLSETSAYAFKEIQPTVELLNGLLRPGDIVLVKGSRGMQMERIVSGITGA